MNKKKKNISTSIQGEISLVHNNFVYIIFKKNDLILYFFKES